MFFFDRCILANVFSAQRTFPEQIVPRGQKKLGPHAIRKWLYTPLKALMVEKYKNDNISEEELDLMMTRFYPPNSDRFLHRLKLSPACVTFATDSAYCGLEMSLFTGRKQMNRDQMDKVMTAAGCRFTRAELVSLCLKVC